MYAAAARSARATDSLSNNNIFQDGVKILADTLARRNHSVEFLLYGQRRILADGGARTAMLTGAADRTLA